MLSTKKTIKTLWIFLTVNYLFCDIFSLSYSEHLKAMLVGELDGIVFTQQFLLFFAFVIILSLIAIVILAFTWKTEDKVS